MSSANWPATLTPMSLDLVIETPENLSLSYQVAGPGWRIVAYGIDFAIRLTILFICCIAMAIAAIVLPGTAMGSMLLVLFLLEWGYTIGFEYAWQGQTPGKRMCGLRVIQENGAPISWWSAALRNLLRVSDMIPYLVLYGDRAGLLTLMPIYGPALICVSLTSRLQRLGDLAARTVVVHEHRLQMPHVPVILNKIEALNPAEVRGVRPSSATLSLIENFLSRRNVLTYERGHALAQPFAVALARQLRYSGPIEQLEKFPMAFLARVYVTYAREPDQGSPDVEQHDS